MDVTQEDRDAAATLVRWIFPNTQDAGEGIAEGHWDKEAYVQAFAAHRERATEELRLALAEADRKNDALTHEWNTAERRGYLRGVDDAAKVAVAQTQWRGSHTIARMIRALGAKPHDQ